MTNGILLTRHNQEITQWSPDPFPRERVGSGHETSEYQAFLWEGEGPRDEAKYNWPGSMKPNLISRLLTMNSWRTKLSPYRHNAVIYRLTWSLRQQSWPQPGRRWLPSLQCPSESLSMTEMETLFVNALWTSGVPDPPSMPIIFWPN